MSYEQYDPLDFWDAEKRACILIQTCTFAHSVKEKYTENKSAKLSFKLTIVIFPEISHCVTLFMVFMFYPTKFFQLGINENMTESKHQLPDQGLWPCSTLNCSL